MTEPAANDPPAGAPTVGRAPGPAPDGPAVAGGWAPPAVSRPATGAPAVVPGPLRRVPLVNLANGLTVLRIGLVPVFVILMVASQMSRSGYQMAAAVAFAAAALTDLADGWIARSFDLVTAFGKVADPIADKVLIGAALVLLSAYDALPWWVTVVILTRELGVTVLRFWVIRHGVIPASRGGKAKTAVQLLAITWYIWPLPAPLAQIGPWIMTAAVVVTVATGVHYAARAMRLRRAGTAGTGVGGRR